MKRLKEDIVRELKFRILSETYKPGQRLPAERELAAEYSVSRPVVHEALLILEGCGLVTMRPRHGAIINNFRQKGTIDLLSTLLLHTDKEELNSHVLSSLYRIRALLESDAARLACIFGSSRDWDALEKIINSGSIGAEAKELAGRDFRIHHFIAFVSGNIVYPLLINSLKPVYIEYLNAFYRNYGDRQELRDLQNELLSAFRKGLCEKAEAIMLKLSSYTLR